MDPKAEASAKTVLLVDDEEAMRRVMERRIAFWGYRVLTASDGNEAVRLAKQQRPDCVLLDVMMPGLNGLEACRQLQRDGDTRQIPVILVSGKAKQITPDDVQGAGAFALLAKPYETSELQQLIQRALEQKEGTA